jgi:phosphoribosylglycinamide formyltransferase 1
VIGVLASGEGTNLTALLREELPVVAVASNVRGARALERASAAGVPTGVFELDAYATREERDDAMARWLADHGAKLAISAGYTQLLTARFLVLFPTINVHPSLLPAFPGMHAVEQALAAGVPETGVTVHFVDEGIDTGPIIAQEPVPILGGDTRGTLQARLRPVEHRLLPTAARRFLAGGLRAPASVGR